MGAQKLENPRSTPGRPGQESRLPQSQFRAQFLFAAQSLDSRDLPFHQTKGYESGGEEITAYIGQEGSEVVDMELEHCRFGLFLDQPPFSSVAPGEMSLKLLRGADRGCSLHERPVIPLARQIASKTLIQFWS